MTSTDDGLGFPDLPPFPTDIPTAPLFRISLQKLLNNDTEELERLWDACRNVGFFYLDLRDATGHNEGIQTSDPIDGNKFIADAGKLFGFADEFYDLPVVEKMRYDFKEQGSYFGYKGYGDGIIDKQGTKDRNEFYNISKDDILAISPALPAPRMTAPYRPFLKSFIQTSHAIVSLLLTHLDSLLRLPLNTLPSLHKLQVPSGDQVRFVRSPPQPQQDRRAALGAHTDFGSVTLLFNRLGGLQILPPSSDGLTDEQKSESWQYVRPLKGHCVVNLGDAMVKFTRGVLRSNVHRVVNPPGNQEGMVRDSLVYFSRPGDEVMLRALEGNEIIDARKVHGVEDEEEVVSSKEWVLRRALGRRGVGDWDKTGGTEELRGRGMREVAA